MSEEEALLQTSAFLETNVPEMCSTTRNVSRKSSIVGLYVCAGGLTF